MGNTFKVAARAVALSGSLKSAVARIGAYSDPAPTRLRSYLTPRDELPAVSRGQLTAFLADLDVNEDMACALWATLEAFAPDELTPSSLMILLREFAPDDDDFVAQLRTVNRIPATPA